MLREAAEAIQSKLPYADTHWLAWHWRCDSGKLRRLQVGGAGGAP